jgi:hypothetical protein
MAEPSLLPALLLGLAVTLPARPDAVAIGDVDGDGSAELAALLVWDAWGSASRDVSRGPGLSEVEVVPAIEQRRELLVFEVSGGVLQAAAPPLPVGPDLLAIEGGAGPLVALTDGGPQIVLLSDRGTLELVPLADVTPLMAGARRLFAGLDLIHPVGITGGGDVTVPVPGGIEIVDWDGSRRHYATPLTERRSGPRPLLRMTIPERVDLDGDGTLDLLDVTRDPANAAPEDRWRTRLAAFRRGIGGGRVAEAIVWELEPILRNRPVAGEERRLIDVLDLDGDGTLEAAILERGSPGGESLGDVLEAIRGQAGKALIYGLSHSGAVGASPEAVVRFEGHLFPLRRANGMRSPLADLDGDGVAELVTFTVSVGWVGAARALVTGTASAMLHSEIWKAGSDGFEAVPGAVPALRFRQDLRDLDLSRFFDWSADLDGDGRVDLVEVDGNEVKIRIAAPGPRYPERPTRTLALEHPVRDWGGIVFEDLDADGIMEMIALEPLADAPGGLARETRLELLETGVGR